MKKTATLILTGWDSDSHCYAHCAALALLAYPDADVRGVSKARLPETLEAAKGYALDERDFSRLLKGYRAVMSDGETFPTAALSGRSDRLEDITRLHVSKVLEKHGGNVSRAATTLDVSRNTVLKYAR